VLGGDGDFFIFKKFIRHDYSQYCRTAVDYWYFCRDVFLGFSVNNLTLMALTIATGFVVDDAIVMLENIARHREAGKAYCKPRLKGLKKSALP
jgi:hypothetical protein